MTVIPEIPTLVLVEDNPADRLLVKDVLRDYRTVHLIEADSGEALVALCQPPATPDLIILDLNLASPGGKSGLEAIQQLPNPIPFIVLTVDNSVRTIRAAAQAGALGYCLKPPAADNLMPAIELALNWSADTPETSRVAIERATGVLMAFHRIDAATASQLLKKAARTARCSKADYAQGLLDSFEQLAHARPDPADFEHNP